MGLYFVGDDVGQRESDAGRIVADGPWMPLGEEITDAGAGAGRLHVTVMGLHVISSSL